MSSTTLYTHKMCPYAQRAWIGLNLAQNEFNMDEIDLYGRKPSYFKKLNPKEQVPVLQMDGKVITER